MEEMTIVVLESEVEKTMVKIVANNAFNGMTGMLLGTEDGTIRVSVGFGESNEFTYVGRLEDIEVVELAS